MRIIFMGTPDFAVPTLQALVDAAHDVVCVYTQPPRPGGRRGRELTPSPVQSRAEDLGIEVRHPTSLKSAEEQAHFAELDADVAVVAAYGLILPQAVLAATIIVAVLSLVDIQAIKTVWTYSKSDFIAMAATILMTLSFGVELGVLTGVGLSLFLHLYNTSKPHFAIVGQVPGTQHFRNIERHDVVTSTRVVTVRVDESLYFANARFLEDTVDNIVSTHCDMRHLILMCPAVNRIDASGLESLEALNHRLKDAGVTLHLSEVKGPVMDRLKRTDFLQKLGGRVFLSQNRAFHELSRGNGDPPLPDDIARGLI